MSHFMKKCKAVQNYVGTLKNEYPEEVVERVIDFFQKYSADNVLQFAQYGDSFLEYNFIRCYLTLFPIIFITNKEERMNHLDDLKKMKKLSIGNKSLGYYYNDKLLNETFSGNGDERSDIISALVGLLLNFDAFEKHHELRYYRKKRNDLCIYYGKNVAFDIIHSSIKNFLDDGESTTSEECKDIVVSRLSKISFTILMDGFEQFIKYLDDLRCQEPKYIVEGMLHLFDIYQAKFVDRKAMGIYGKSIFKEFVISKCIGIFQDFKAIGDFLGCIRNLVEEEDSSFLSNFCHVNCLEEKYYKKVGNFVSEKKLGEFIFALIGMLSSPELFGIDSSKLKNMDYERMNELSEFVMLEIYIFALDKIVLNLEDSLCLENSKNQGINEHLNYLSHLEWKNAIASKE